MKKKGIVDFIVPVGFMLIGVVSIIFAILCFTYAYPGAYYGGYTWYEYYGGDAYTGIQHAAADTANNIYLLAGELKWYIYDLQTTNGYFMTIIGAVLIFFGLNKFFKVLKGNNKPQSITIGNVQSNTIETIQPKISYQAWTCPKCGERNNYAAKNCINCFEPKP